MELDHRFSVPAGIEETWAHFEDVASVAECFPGAAVTSVEDSTFQGTVKVKLGPIALVYNGSGTFTEKDEEAHRFVVEAKGKDKRGNGTAGATVTLAMTPSTAGGTDVSVHTDLAITGKPAQFGRGVMQDVSDKLLGQFVACLEQRLGAGSGSEGSGEAQTAAATSSIPPVVAAPSSEPSSEPVAQAEAEPTPRTPAAPLPAMQPAAPRDDALNLGSTVLPILARTYWKHALVAVVVIAVVVWLIAG